MGSGGGVSGGMGEGWVVRTVILLVSVAVAMVGFLLLLVGLLLGWWCRNGNFQLFCWLLLRRRKNCRTHCPLSMTLRRHNQESSYLLQHAAALTAARVAKRTGLPSPADGGAERATRETHATGAGDRRPLLNDSGRRGNSSLQLARSSTPPTPGHDAPLLGRIG